LSVATELALTRLPIPLRLETERGTHTEPIVGRI
jgi:hypothetical protein